MIIFVRCTIHKSSSSLDLSTFVTSNKVQGKINTSFSFSYSLKHGVSLDHIHLENRI